MNRDAKTLQAHSRAHTVTLADTGWDVTSGRSGRTYRVTPVAGGAWCSCPWGSHQHTACSHVLAVYDSVSVEMGVGHVAAWSSRQAADRQHRPEQYLADVWLTVRRGPAPTRLGLHWNAETGTWSWPGDTSSARHLPGCSVCMPQKSTICSHGVPADSCEPCVFRGFMEESR